MSSLLHTIFIICMKVIFRLGMFIGIRCACNLYDTEFMCYFILLLLQNADCTKQSIKNLATLLTNIFKVQSMPIQHFTLKTMVARSFGIKITLFLNGSQFTKPICMLILVQYKHSKGHLEIIFQLTPLVQKKYTQWKKKGSRCVPC